jgi:[ribosomal protein S5]-alanine N-acetyltransferase
VGERAPSVRLGAGRTVVRTAVVADAAAIVLFYVENRARFEPFDPERPPIFYEERFWRMQILQNEEDLAADRALRLFVFRRSEPDRVIGSIGFSNIVRGAAHYCQLGYALAGDAEGQGLMSEALRAAIDHAFRELNLHRIEANYLPHNLRSGALLRRLGFVVEGYSRDYLRIAGRWEDHVRAALLNPAWTDSNGP